MNVVPTGIIFYGVCQVLSEYCRAREGGTVTAVRTVEHEEQINTCKPCLNYKIKNREWNINGAYVSGMRQQLDLAVVDNDGKVLVAVEVKNWGRSSLSWANKIAEKMIARNRIHIPFLIIATPKHFFIFTGDSSIDNGFVKEIDISAHIVRVAKELNISQDFTINEGSDFRGSQHLTVKKHMILERIVKYMLMDDEVLFLLPKKMIKIIESNTINMEYVVLEN